MAARLQLEERRSLGEGVRRCQLLAGKKIDRVGTIRKKREHSEWRRQEVEDFHYHAGPKVLRLPRSRWVQGVSRTTRSAKN
jgi:hypothetical protein